MIVLFSTQAHAHTHRPLQQSDAFDFRVMSYHRLFRRRRLPRATYIFTDFDRLNFWDLEMAGRIHRQLREAGACVLNDPARVRSRFELLRDLHARRFNDFGVWRVDETPPDGAYPVFLRTESAHRGPLTGCLDTPESLAQAVAEAIDRGIPRRELMVVQFHAEPVADGLYRKLAAYRVGGRIVPALCAHQDHWAAKYGQNGIAGQALYEDELRLVNDNPFADALAPAFETGHIDYGRADFALIGGRPQVYEINTNPHVGRLRTHPYPIRLDSYRSAQRQLIAAMAEIDGPASGRPVPLHDPRSLRDRLADLWRGREWRRTPRLP
ncbi:hypothetical protein ACN2MM_12575 [Alkalilimnicola ehrlichii MLHE-1]|uniref:ATP-grasp domain-containing protein n=1 Tax=Alkalilimnicola ehrlichii (strain ATCC BAA-1101 / DSM 17681 / MLHE-1) TaxID=187272 RepID=Q0A634_ALKEH|nr:hypothetical protein [Alkalilimnicola ehrlichii]ABI57703.1 hypothetical protein Mlg_2363 [Alkalilimnicola ehrlichii MLHE-1]